MTVQQLTGKIRYREHKRWFRKTLMVLEVEYHDYLCEDEVAWRDACFADVQQLLTEDYKEVCDE